MKLLITTCMAGCLLMACGTYPHTEVHLLPAGYQGDVFIVPGIAAGAPPIREGGAIVFRIPADGVLVTQDHPKSEWHRSRFYYLQSDKERQRLDYEPASIPNTSKNRADRRPIVWFERSGTVSGVDLPCSVDYVQYYVGSRAHLLARPPDLDELRFRDYLKKNHVCN